MCVYERFHFHETFSTSGSFRPDTVFFSFASKVKEEVDRGTAQHRGSVCASHPKSPGFDSRLSAVPRVQWTAKIVKI